MSEIANPRYCPTDWLDEVNPLGDTPEAFARRIATGWLLIDPDEKTEAETNLKGPLEAGQIIKFARLTSYEDITLIVHENGTHTADLPDFDGHPSFRMPDWEWEDVVDNLSELISIGTREDWSVDKPLEPGEYTVECWSWHDGASYRFQPDGDTPKFAICAGAN